MDMTEDLLKTIHSLDETYSIGVHGITGREKNIEKAENIIRTGLQNKGWGGILSNVTMYGQIKDLTDDDYNKILNYCYGEADFDNHYANILVATPESFQDQLGKTYFLGHFNKVSGYAKGKDSAGDSNPLNMLVEESKILKIEFIVGYYCRVKNQKEIIFKLNPNFIGFRSKEEQIAFFEKLKSQLAEISDIDEIMKSDIDEIMKSDIDEIMKSLELYKYFNNASEYIRQLEEFVNNLSTPNKTR